jgi:hypothetical protein
MPEPQRADVMTNDISQSEDHCRDALRERLVFMRGDLIGRLARKGIDAGMLSLLGSVGAAIAALDATPTERLAGD